MLQARSVVIKPSPMLQNIAAPSGPLPPANAASGGAEGNSLAGMNLLGRTIRQVNTMQVNGLGGNVDLLG